MSTIPLRGLVIFPGVTVSLDLQRSKTVKTMNNALEKGDNVFFVTQRDYTIEEPQVEDLYDIGTVARVKQVLKLPQGITRVFIEGIARAELHEFLERDEEYTGLISVDEAEEMNFEDPKLSALFRMLNEQVEDVFPIMQKTSPDMVNQLLATNDSEVKLNQLIEFLLLPFEKAQVLLEAETITERLEQFLAELNNEFEFYKIREEIENEVRKNLDKHQKDHILREEMRVIQKKIDGDEDRKSEVEELKEKIEAAGMPEKVEATARKELKRYEKTSSSSPEHAVIRNYIGWLIDLPWNKESKVNINILKVKKSLDKDHFGLEKVKDAILDYLAVQKMKGSMKSPIICLVGPPGVGKTSLAKSIATSTGREFVRVSLGGVRDEAEIRGHRRTYVGAMPGRIIQGMKRAGTTNPVFLLDEIDKMSNDFRGDPSSAMLEVLDPEQNCTFSDHYIEETYDLSNVMFIATANNLGSIPGPLRDRMEVIQLSSYTEIEKLNIAKNHLLKKQIGEQGLTKEQITVKPDTLKRIVRNYTREAGVRSLERQIGKVCRKVTREILETEAEAVVVDKNKLVAYLGQPAYEYETSGKKDLIGVANGLAYTTVGGDTLQIEVALTPGKGKLQLTGKLGDVMKESAQTAMTYIKSNLKELNVEPKKLDEVDIHIHVPEGAVPKDGPSAGITIATALASALTERKVRKEIGMTGEITLRGRVLPIGGLKEKSISAHRAGLKVIICPENNKKDLEDVPETVRKDLEFIFVSEASDVLKKALI